MEQLEKEQTENGAHTAEAETEISGAGTREISFKKFKNVESLQKAYSSLESEFTKRSQRLKELTGERDELKRRLEEKTRAEEFYARGGYAGLGEFFKKHPEAREYVKELAENSAGGGENGFVDAYVTKLERQLKEGRERLNDEEYLYGQIGNPIKDRIIREYLVGVKNTAPEFTAMTGGGEIALAPPIKPTTIEEAGRLAESVLVRKN